MFEEDIGTEYTDSFIYNVLVIRIGGSCGSGAGRGALVRGMRGKASVQHWGMHNQPTYASMAGSGGAATSRSVMIISSSVGHGAGGTYQSLHRHHYAMAGQVVQLL